ncbi:uncharacterized protein [Amphiura filiformis]|uniref:uncharacterized protein n=1 Tax=Amphiura filiformis TaxID=82378 RepID=UPI003B21E6D9
MSTVPEEHLMSESDHHLDKNDIFADQQQPTNPGSQQQPPNSDYQQQLPNRDYQQQHPNPDYQQQPTNSDYQQQPTNSDYQHPNPDYQQQPTNSDYQQHPPNQDYQQHPPNQDYQQQATNPDYQQQPANRGNQHGIAHPNQEQFDMSPSELHHGTVQNEAPVLASSVNVDGVVVNNNPTMHAVDDDGPKVEIENANLNEYPQNADENLNQKQIQPDMYALDLSDNNTRVINKTEIVEESAISSGPANQSDQMRESKVDSDSVCENQPQNDDKVNTVDILPRETNFAAVSFYQFKCKFCNASFDRRKTFKKHLTNEHGVLPYICNLCGMGYDHKSDLKDHIKAHTEENAVDDEQSVDQKTESSQIDSDDGRNSTEAESYKVTQINPDQHKLQLTKSLRLLAQVSHMRDTREARNVRSAASEESPSQIVLETESNANERQTVPNKRKRGRPRRLPDAQLAANRRKGRQPRKINKTVKKEPAKKDLIRKPRKSKKHEEGDIDEYAANVNTLAKILTKEVTKGNYKLRPQSIDMDYRAQLQSKTELLPFECRYCHIDFKTKAKKLRHEKIHKEFKCSTCSIRCATFKDMKRHEDKHFPDEMKCHFCQELFKIKKDLWIHEETHDQTVVCRWCAATFDKRQDLDGHERLHFISKTSNTIFECHYCQKICKSRKAWKSHLVSYSSIKAYECDICGKKYKQQGSYNLHMQRHNDTFYKFTCQFCGKKYGQKALMIIHERTHTNERPYKCTHCDLAYPSKNQLDHHMQRVLGVKHMCSF